MADQWKSGLFDCFSDMSSCCCVWFCTPCAYGQIVNILNTGQPGGACGDCGACCIVTFLGGLAFVVTCSTRKQIRMKYGLPEEPCNDCIVHWCCWPCALCQEFREVKQRNNLYGAPAMPVPEEMTR